jgi:hypothetical protein
MDEKKEARMKSNKIKKGTHIMLDDYSYALMMDDRNGIYRMVEHKGKIKKISVDKILGVYINPTTRVPEELGNFQGAWEAVDLEEVHAKKLVQVKKAK